MKLLHLYAATAAVSCLLVSPVDAGHCVRRQRVVLVQQHAYVAPVVAAQVAYPVAYYQVGSAIREEAVAERAAILALEKFAAALQQQQGGNGGGVGLPPDSGGANEMDAVAQGIVSASCVRCHSGPEPKGNLNLTDVTKLSREQRLDVGSKAFLGLMPLNAGGTPAPLPDETANFLLKWSQDAADAADIPGTSNP